MQNLTHNLPMLKQQLSACSDHVSDIAAEHFALPSLLLCHALSKRQS